MYLLQVSNVCVRVCACMVWTCLLCLHLTVKLVIIETGYSSLHIQLVFQTKICSNFILSKDIEYKI